MRREMGEAEKRLWTRLRRNQIGFHFRRQAPVGPYFLDFYCAKARLCIEVDGDLHAQRSAEDRQRELYLQQLGNPTCHLVKSSRVCGYNPPTHTQGGMGWRWTFLVGVRYGLGVHRLWCGGFVA